MKLRVNVEGRDYEVEVDVLGSARETNGNVRARNLPEQVLRPRPPQKLPEDSVCRSPIAGRVTALAAEAGRRVRRHEAVVVVEAMKMEIPIGPAVDGTVKAILVRPGDSVAAGQALFELD